MVDLDDARLQRGANASVERPRSIMVGLGRRKNGEIITERPLPSGIPLSALAGLMLAVFAVSVGFGVTLPLLPFLIERLLGPDGDAAQVSRATGLLTSLYMLSLFLFAPAWGRLSDRFGRRPILLIGLLGFSAATFIFAFIETLPSIYVERLLSGLFAAAVTPVALATIGDLAKTEEQLAHKLTFVSLAGISGVLLGPMVGVFVSQAGAALFPGTSEIGSLSYPLAGIAIITLFSAAAIFFAVPDTNRNGAAPRRVNAASKSSRWLVPLLLSLASIVSAAVGVFEVGLALRGKQDLGLTQVQIALMFTTCSLVMIVMQAIIFFSPWVRPATTRWLIAPALGVLAAGLFLVPRASSFTLMLAAVGVVAASAGILAPILTYWISSKAGRAQGAQLGKQTAAASVGGAIGSAAGGLLFNVSLIPDAPFVLISALIVLGLGLSLRLPKMLSTGKLEKAD
jgi:predicted MFS family arabinose efflux permease